MSADGGLARPAENLASDQSAPALVDWGAPSARPVSAASGNRSTDNAPSSCGAAVVEFSPATAWASATSGSTGTCRRRLLRRGRIGQIAGEMRPPDHALQLREAKPVAAPDRARRKIDRDGGVASDAAMPSTARSGVAFVALTPPAPLNSAPSASKALEEIRPRQMSSAPASEADMSPSRPSLQRPCSRGARHGRAPGRPATRPAVRAAATMARRRARRATLSR